MAKLKYLLLLLIPFVVACQSDKEKFIKLGQGKVVTFLSKTEPITFASNIHFDEITFKLDNSSAFKMCGIFAQSNIDRRYIVHGAKENNTISISTVSIENMQKSLPAFSWITPDLASKIGGYDKNMAYTQFEKNWNECLKD